MASFPPIPPFPTVPFSLPFNLQVADNHILKVPPEKDSCTCCVKEFLDCLIQAPIPWQGCDWILQVNKKVYLIVWRDKLPRGPATRQVWDIFRLDPPRCGNCPTTPFSLGWQWCWDTVIQTIWNDVKNHWVGDDLHGGGKTSVLLGTNIFVPGSPWPQIGPVLHLDASQEDTLTLNGALVERWEDLSTRENHAVQGDPGFQPTYLPASFQGKGTVSFNGANFLQLPLKAVSTGWHVFVVGQYLAAPDQGTFFAATGVVSPYSGMEAKIFQSLGAFPQGTVSSYVHPAILGLQIAQAPASTFGIMEWSETSTSLSLGLNAFTQTVSTGDLSADVVWNPTVQVGAQAIPLPAYLGRSVWGLEGQPWDYLTGSIAEILVYPARLSGGQRIQVLNALREKWGLGAPLPLDGV